MWVQMEVWRGWTGTGNDAADALGAQLRTGQMSDIARVGPLLVGVGVGAGRAKDKALPRPPQSPTIHAQ